MKHMQVVPPAGGAVGVYGDLTTTVGDGRGQTTPHTTAAAARIPSATWCSTRTAAASPLDQLPTPEEDSMSVPTPAPSDDRNDPNGANFAEFSPHLSTAAVIDVLDEHGYTCSGCDRRLYEAFLSVVLDVPVSRGGAHERDNLTVSCSLCESDRGALTMREYRAWRHATGGAL